MYSRAWVPRLLLLLKLAGPAAPDQQGVRGTPASPLPQRGRGGGCFKRILVYLGHILPLSLNLQLSFYYYYLGTLITGSIKSSLQKDVVKRARSNAFYRQLFPYSSGKMARKRSAVWRQISVLARKILSKGGGGRELTLKVFQFGKCWVLCARGGQENESPPPVVLFWLAPQLPHDPQPTCVLNP